MACLYCGHVLADYEKKCPRCMPVHTNFDRSLRPEEQTRMLIALGQCPSCRLPILGRQDVCLSCGAQLRKASPAHKPARRALAWENLLGLGITLLALFLIIFWARTH